MLVVSDTSPLRALQSLDLVGVLQPMYREVLVPPAVARELLVEVPGLGALRVSDHPGLLLRAPADAAQVAKFASHVNAGEAEALALALEVRADVVLIDEVDGRRLAASLGLRTTGALALLVQAKRAGLLTKVGPLLERLDTRIGFRVSPALRDRILRDAGED